MEHATGIELERPLERFTERVGEREPSSRPLFLLAAGFWLAGACGQPNVSAVDARLDAPTPDADAPVRLVISEIMYHPVLENSFVEAHEFVEIHNPGPSAVELDGYALSAGISYTFPDGARVAAGGRVVVAKDRAALMALDAYGLDPSVVFGDYQGELDNRGDVVEIRARDGSILDRVEYDDKAPWPIGADGLGAGESWLPAEDLPLSAHQYLGRSLERLSSDHASNAPANWQASPLDGATPGRPPTSVALVPRAVVMAHAVAPADGVGSLVHAGDPARVEVTFSALGELAGARLEYYVDQLGASAEPLVTVDLSDDGTGGDTSAGDRRYTAVLPGLAASSVVRYRVLADRGAGFEVVSPRPSDPMAFHGYFVDPALATGSRTYHVFIDPEKWTAMWDNVAGGRVVGCEPSSTWGARVPAVFVHEGRVYDVQVRYQGSRYNRTNGPALSSWPYPGPARPSPVRALSWRVAFPRYATFEDRRVITLNKMTQSCPGYNAMVGFELFRSVDLPGAHARYVRLQVNGGYYHYHLELERPGEDFMQRYHEAMAVKYPGMGIEPVGHLFKAAGCNCDEGPFGWADGRELAPYCGFSAEQRYQATYDRKTHEFADHAALIELIQGLHAARAQGSAAERAFLEQHFDIDLMLSYLAVINWSVPFDDYFQNHFLYQRRTDGKWHMVPWDLDRNFGGWQGANSSIFMGEQGDPSNRQGWWHYIKDSFLRVYRAEYVTRLKELNETALHPSRIEELVDAAMASADPAEAALAPAGLACDFQAEATRMKNFAWQRYDFVRAQ